MTVTTTLRQVYDAAPTAWLCTKVFAGKRGVDHDAEFPVADLFQSNSLPEVLWILAVVCRRLDLVGAYTHKVLEFDPIVGDTVFHVQTAPGSAALSIWGAATTISERFVHRATSEDIAETQLVQILRGVLS